MKMDFKNFLKNYGKIKEIFFILFVEFFAKVRGKFNEFGKKFSVKFKEFDKLAEFLNKFTINFNNFARISQQIHKNSLVSKAFR